MTNAKEHLKRAIGVAGLSANLVNTMIGAGIFALPAIVAAGLGSAGIFAYLFCGLLVALVMLCFAEVGSKVTVSGGAYAYIVTAFGPYFGFLTAILFVLSAIAADAAVANAIADVAAAVFPRLGTTPLRVLFFLLVFGGLGYVNIKGAREGITLVKVITIAKLLPLLLLVLFSWGEVSLDQLSMDAGFAAGDLGKISLVLFFAFQGAESGLSVSGEVKSPQSAIPKAIFLSVAGVLMLYILIQTVSQGVLGDALATAKENTLGLVAERVFGPTGFVIMTVAAALSMFGNLSSEVLGMPRVLFRAARDGVLPVKSLARVHQKFATPYVAVMSYASLAFLFASVGGFEQLAIISSATILLVYFGVALSVIRLRLILPASPGEFRLQGGFLIPILSSCTIVWLLSNLSRQEAVTVGLFIVGLTLLYFTGLRKKRGGVK